MSNFVRTIAAHERSFERAPRVRAGEAVRHLREDASNPGWFLGVAPDGVEGYFPSRWFELETNGRFARALRDYDASELTIEAGVEVTFITRESGWVLVRTHEGRNGWIPARCLDPQR